jgi:hypothetical protein
MALKTANKQRERRTIYETLFNRSLKRKKKAGKKVKKSFQHVEKEINSSRSVMRINGNKLNQPL